MIGKLSACYERLQKLQIAPTKNNMELLLQTLYDLKDIYNHLEGGVDIATENGTTVNSDGRNTD